MARQEIEVRVVDKTQAALRNINTRLGKLQTGLLGVNRLAAAAVTAFAGFATGAGVKGILNATQAMEGFRTQLTTYLGSQELANAEIARLSKLARSLPQDVNELTEAFVIFNRFGLDTSNESMKAFSNIAAANSKSITQLGEAVADALTGEFERLKEFGVKVSKENGRFVARIGEDQVAVSTSTKGLIDQLKALGAEGGRFGNVTIGSLTLAMSNFRGAIFETGAALGEGGFGLAIADALTGLTDLLTKNDEAITKIGDGLTKAFLYAKEAIILVFDNIELLAKGFAIFLGLKFAVGVGQIATALAGPLVKAIVLATKAMKAFTLMMLRNPIIAAGVGIAAIIEKTTGAFSKLAEELGIIGEDSVLDNMVESGKELTMEIAGPLVNGIKQVGGISEKVSKDFEDIKNRAKDTKKTLSESEAALETQKKAEEAMLQAQKEKTKQLKEIISGKLEELRVSGLTTEEQQKIKLEKELTAKFGEDIVKNAQSELKAYYAQSKELQNQVAIRKQIDELTTLSGFNTQAKALANLEKAYEQALQLQKDYLDDSYSIDNQFYTGKELMEMDYQQKRFNIIKGFEDRIKELQMKNIREALGENEKATTRALTDKEKEFLFRRGFEERQREIVNKRIEFEKKSELEKGQFALEQANTLFAGLGRVNKKFFAAQKAIAIAQAVINTYQGATKALATYPPPFNFLAAAGVVASGLAQVATIRAQTYQRGGDMLPNRPAIVGEGGAELVVPKQPSTVIPNEVARAMGNMNGEQGVQVNFNITTTDARGFDELLVERRSTIVGIINQAMNTRGRTGVTA